MISTGPHPFGCRTLSTSKFVISQIAITTGFPRPSVAYSRGRLIWNRTLFAPRPTVDATTNSPWLTLGEAATYVRRGRRWLRKEATDGRVRHAIVGGRKEMLFRREWLDQHLEDLATPTIMPMRKRA